MLLLSLSCVAIKHHAKFLKDISRYSKEVHRMCCSGLALNFSTCTVDTSMITVPSCSVNFSKSSQSWEMLGMHMQFCGFSFILFFSLHLWCNFFLFLQVCHHHLLRTQATMSSTMVLTMSLLMYSGGTQSLMEESQWTTIPSVAPTL